MNWDDDLEFMAEKKGIAKQGRRAGLVPQSPDTQVVLLENAIDLEDGVQAPVRVRKTGKWADEGSKSARKNSTNLIEQERFRDMRRDDSDDDIPVIPDVDDLQDEILMLHEIKAPTVSVNKATYKELDSELVSLQRGQKLASSGNINLSFLISKLHPEKDVKDVDEQWTMEELYENLMNMNKDEDV